MTFELKAVVRVVVPIVILASGTVAIMTMFANTALSTFLLTVGWLLSAFRGAPPGKNNLRFIISILLIEGVLSFIPPCQDPKGAFIVSAISFLYFAAKSFLPRALTLRTSDSIWLGTYRALWIIGLANSALAFRTAFSKRTTEVDQYGYAVAFGVLTLIFLVILYADLERIETNPTQLTDYPDWINRKSERLLRWLIVISLLFGVGEFSKALVPILSRDIGFERFRSSAIQFLTDSVSNSLLWGGIFAFTFLLFWNVGALKCRQRFAQRTPDATSLQQATTIITTCRICCFLLVAILSAAYWLIVVAFPTYTGLYSLGGLALYILPAGIFLLLRLDTPSKWITLKTADRLKGTSHSELSTTIAIAYPVSDIGKIAPFRAFSLDQRRDWWATLIRIYGHMMEAAEQGPYDVTVNSTKLIVDPNVYAPGFFTDSAWFASELPKVVGTSSLLEIGTGTGVVAIACALASERVVAVDINPFAVQNALKNVAQCNVQVDVRESNLYDSVGTREKFDCIFWAHPFNNWSEPIPDMLLRSGLDHNYEGLRGYIRGARRHLNKQGRLLLGTGDSADLDSIGQIAADLGYGVRDLIEAELPLQEGSRLRITYKIVELVRV